MYSGYFGFYLIHDQDNNNYQKFKICKDHKTACKFKEFVAPFDAIAFWYSGMIIWHFMCERIACIIFYQKERKLNKLGILCQTSKEETTGYAGNRKGII